MRNDEIAKVLRYIEENMRVTEQTSIEYLDPQRHVDRLGLKQNQIVFGRRGSGKSLLLKSLRGKHNNACINVNLEDFKDVSFPDSIAQVQKSIFKQLIPLVKKRHGIFSVAYWKQSRPIINELKRQIKILDGHLAAPDVYDETTKRVKVGKTHAGGKGNLGGAVILPRFPGHSAKRVISNPEVNNEVETIKNRRIA